MTMRVTQASQAANEIAYLQSQYNNLSNIEEQTSTGFKINVPSDGPAAEVTIINAQAQDSTYTTDLSSISDATDTLNQSVTVLNQVSQLLSQASSIASEGVSGTGSGSATTDTTLAQQTNSLITEALNLANTQINGQYLYAGTASSTTPFSAATTNSQGLPETVSYSGSQDSGQSSIGQGQTVTTQAAGSQVFQSPTGDVFQALIGLRDLLNNTTGLSSSAQSSALSQQIGVIKNANDSVNATIGSQSDSLQNMSSLTSNIQNLQLQTQTTISNNKDADLSSLVVQLQEAQNTYQVTLSSTSDMFSQSNNLMYYLTAQGL
jgi:flagellar hook-associated protein 3 FlgL